MGKTCHAFELFFDGRSDKPGAIPFPHQGVNFLDDPQGQAHGCDFRMTNSGTPPTPAATIDSFSRDGGGPGRLSISFKVPFLFAQRVLKFIFPANTLFNQGTHPLFLQPEAFFQIVCGCLDLGVRYSPEETSFVVLAELHRRFSSSPVENPSFSLWRLLVITHSYFTVTFCQPGGKNAENSFIPPEPPPDAVPPHSGITHNQIQPNRHPSDH